MKKLLFLLFLLPASLFAQCSGITNTNPHKLPDGLNYFYILDANTTYTPPGTSLTANTGTSFDAFRGTPPITVPDNDSNGILSQIKAAAVASFLGDWGIKFTGANFVSDGGDWNLNGYIMPLEYGQKVLVSGGQTVPASGWTVYQAEWRAEANNDFAMIPSGVWADERLAQLGLPSGASPIPVQSHTSITYGVLRVVCTDGVTTNPFDIRYTSVRPMFPDTIVNFVNPATNPDKYNSTRIPNSYYVSLNGGSTWTGQGKGRFELQNLGANYKAISKLIMKFYTP